MSTWADTPGSDRVGFVNLTADSGLSSGVVSEVIQDRKGQVWAATDYGLNRFDGFEVDVFHHSPNSPDSLSSNHLTALCEDSAGMLWVGTANAGLNRFDPSTGRCVRLSTTPGERGGLKSQLILSLAFDPRGFVWVGTGSGLHRINIASQVVRIMPAELGHEPVSAVRLDAQGQVWAATTVGGVYLLDESADFHKRVLKGKTSIRDIAFDGKGTLWLATQGEGLIKADAKSGKIIKIYKPEKDGASHNAGLPSLEVAGLLIDGRKHLWVGTSRGLARFDPAAETFQVFRRNGVDPLGIAANSILSLSQGTNGALWIGTEGGGISRTRLDGYWFPVVREGLSHPSVWGMIHSRNGRIRIGTDSGLNEWDPKTGEFTQPLAGLDNLPSTYIYALLEDRKGRLWMGTRGGGVMRMEPDGERIVLFRHDPARPDSLVHDTVSEIFEDSLGRIWIGTLGSGPMQFLARGDGDNSLRPLRIGGKAEGASSRARNVTSFCQDPADRLWMGAGDGLYRLNPETGVLTHYSHFKIGGDRLSSDAITVIHPDPKGNLWIGTAGGGLNQYNPGTGRVVTINRENSRLPDNQIMGVLDDGEGFLWVSTARGLARIDSSTREVRPFHREDGLQGDVFHAKAFTRGKDGRLFFGGNNGFNIIDPKRVPEKKNLPAPVLTGLEIRGKGIDPSPGGILEQPVSEGGSFELPFARNNRVTFRFGVTDISSATGASFRYRLEGLEEEWRVTRFERRADYAGLPAGTYTFRVQAGTKSDKWNPESAEIAMVALPPWHRTWRAYVLFGLGAIALLSGLATVLSYARVSLQRQANRDLEAQQAGTEVRLHRQRHHTLLLEKTNREIGTAVLRSRPFESVLKQLSDHFASCRSLILTIDRNRQENGEPALTLMAQSCHEGIPELPGDPVPSGGRPFLDRALQTAQAISSRMPEYEAETHEPLRNLLLGWGVKSFVAVPMLHHGRPTGLLILHQIAEERSWSSDEIDLLESIGCLLGFAFEQMKAAERPPVTPPKETEPTPHVLPPAVKQATVRAGRETGEVSLKESRFEIRPLLISVERMIALKARMTRTDWIMDLPEALPNLVRADADKLRQVLLTLAACAVSRSPEGKVALDVGARVFSRPKVEGEFRRRKIGLTFEIRDSGPTLDESQISSLFPRIAEVTENGGDGENGYGLSIARALIHRMGGQFGVTPGEAGGLVFRVGIPCEEMVPTQTTAAEGNTAGTALG